jgi:chloride channel protein, CIC family
LPVINETRRLVGVLTRRDIRDLGDDEGNARRTLGDVVRQETVAAYPDEPLRLVVYRMAEKGLTRMPVVERETGHFLGLVSLDDLLKARARHLEEERRRERPLKLTFLIPGARIPKNPASPG